MADLRFDAQIAAVPGFRADAILGGKIFEVLVEPRDLRRIRAALMDMARVAAATRARKVVLVLEEPHITHARLRDEWDGAASVVRPALFARLSLAIRRSGQWSGAPSPPTKTEIVVLEEVVTHTLSEQPLRSTKGSEAHYEILRILLNRWLLDQGPIAINVLMTLSGNSHPTVARALNKLSHYLKRHTDRSVELRFFPRDEWARLVALADEVRTTVRFEDRSGKPRSPASLLRRLQKLEREDIAVGGVAGARHYQRSLDLIGNPRLDLSLHCSGKAMDLAFIQQLDPGLARTTRRDAEPTLVMHAVRRAHTLFERSEDGQQYADPVDCLLDLHDLRLEPQALDFVTFFSARRRAWTGPRDAAPGTRHRS